MTTLTTPINSTQFLAAFGDSQWVRGFSLEATQEILSQINQLHDEGEESLDWTPFFMEACEYSPSLLADLMIKKHASDMSDELFNFVKDWVYMGDDEGIFDEEAESFNAKKEMQALLDANGLTKDAGFNNDLIEFLKHNLSLELKELDNGNWLQMQAQY